MCNRYNINIPPGRFCNDFAGRTLANASYTNPNTYPYTGFRSPANAMLLIPASVGTAAAFITGFTWYGCNLTAGYFKFIFFVNIYTIIATFGVGIYIYQILHLEEKEERFWDIIPPVALMTLYYAAAYNLIYSLYPFNFSGTIGKTPVGQFISFLAKSIGSISVGETFNIVQETPGVQILTAMEAVFTLFAIVLLISLIVK